MRARRKKRTRVALAFGLLLVLAVVALAVTDGVLSVRFGEMYSEQPWARVLRSYVKIDDGVTLSIHRDAVVANLDRDILDRDGYAIGFVTSLAEPESGQEGGRVRLELDVPTFAEEVNLFRDDVRIEADPAQVAGIAKGDLVIARGKMTNFSRWGLWMTAEQVRPLSAIEKYYIRKVLPPTNHMREPMGFDALAKGK